MGSVPLPTRAGPRVGVPVLIAVALLAAAGPVVASQESGAPDLAGSDGHPAGLAEVVRHLDAGRYEEAEEAGRRLLARVEGEHGTEARQVAVVLDHLVQSLWRQGRAAEPEARRWAERAVTIKRAVHGPDHPETARSLGQLGQLHVQTQDYAAADSLLERALAISESAGGAPPHPVLAQNLNWLAGLRWWTGDFAAARELWERALETLERDLGLDHPRVASLLANLALVSEDLGDYRGARRYYERAVELHRRDDPDHPRLGRTLSNLGVLLWRMGDLEVAASVLREALEVRRRSLGPEHPDVAGTLNNLAMVHRAGGELSRARELYERSLEIKERTVGPEHPWTANTLNNLGNLHLEMGGHEKAEAHHRRALAIRERVLGEQHPDVAKSLESLGRVLVRAGRPGEARSVLERGLAIRELRLGDDHPEVAVLVADLAETLWALGDASRAVRLALRAERQGREHLRVTARGLSEREALAFAAERSSGLSVLLSAATVEPDGPAREAAWDAVIRSRALVLDEMAGRNRAILLAEKPDLRRRMEAYRRATTRLAGLWVGGPGSSPEEYRERLAAAVRERREAATDLADAGASLRSRVARPAVGLEEVRNALPAGSALVAYARYDHRAPGAGAPAEPSYLAFVLSAGGERSAVVALGAARDIERRVRRWREEVVRGREFPGRSAADAEAASRRAGEALRRAVWDPVADHVGDADRVLVVPDGALHLVNPAALPLPGGRYLVEADPALHLLSAERDLLAPSPAPSPREDGLLAVGGPAYDGGDPTRFLPAGLRPAVEGVMALSPFRGEISACEAFRARRFAALPAAASEAEQVAALWRDADPRGEPVVLSGTAATEEAVKRLAPGRRVLHLATHGFVLSGPCGSALEEDREGAVPIAGENPLLLSGLALAGANLRSETPPGEEDGILTAQEIAALDLSGVEWAVLSACDTGRGRIRAGEGVLGLQRAFRVAGARTVVMSLWPVRDEDARRWMRALYEARGSRELGTDRAVREASRSVLRRARTEGRSTHPFHWAAFVASGDWR